MIFFQYYSSHFGSSIIFLVSHSSKFVMINLPIQEIRDSILNDNTDDVLIQLLLYNILQIVEVHRIAIKQRYAQNITREKTIFKIVIKSSSGIDLSLVIFYHHYFS